jgi:5-methylcytosine-specific restriction endonuclease McrA
MTEATGRLISLVCVAWIALIVGSRHVGAFPSRPTCSILAGHEQPWTSAVAGRAPHSKTTTATGESPKNTMEPSAQRPTSSLTPRSKKFKSEHLKRKKKNDRDICTLHESMNKIHPKEPMEQLSSSSLSSSSVMSSTSNDKNQVGRFSIGHLDRHPALVLNADYQPMTYSPLSMWHWQEAIKAVFSGKVTVVDVYPDITIRAARLAIPLPSVIVLNQYVPKRYNNRQATPAFTKRNVFLRDEYRCQYCSGRFPDTKDLSLDHVQPRCMGGRLHWENAVTSCHACNRRKGCLTVSELRAIGMRLVREPRVPTQFELAAIASRLMMNTHTKQQMHASWEPFLRLAPATLNAAYAALRAETTSAIVAADSS